MTTAIEDFKPYCRNSLRGFCRVRFTSGIVISGVTVHSDNGKSWASPPSRPMVDRDGVALRDEVGKVRYDQIITFADPSARRRFSDDIVTAMHAAYPEALA